MPESVATRIVEFISSDIVGRQGLGDLWDGIDDDIKDEIVDTWVEGIAEIIKEGWPSLVDGASLEN